MRIATTDQLLLPVGYELLMLYNMEVHFATQLYW